MKFLVTNDDGVFAEGIKALVSELVKITTDILVVAPTTQKSATSHMITLTKGFKVEKIEDIIPGIPTYSLDGSPADCVIFATSMLDFDYDICFSGCNNGYNLSYDVIYSGTVAGAKEAVLQNKIGIAVSCEVKDFQSLYSFNTVYKYIIDSGILNKCPLLNVNFPQQTKGIKITFQGISDYQSHYQLKEDGLYHAMFALPQKMVNTDPLSDWLAIKAGYVSITPMTPNNTDFSVFREYKDK